MHLADSAYCFPIAPNKIVLRLRAAAGDLCRVQVIYESKYVIGKRQKYALMRKAYETGLFDYFEVTLTLKDTRLGYVFLVDDGNKKQYFSEDGLSDTYDFTLGFYNFFQYPYINEADIMDCVPWMKNACFYQIFVDRFLKGDSDKDTSYIDLKWGDIPNPKSMAGGDLKGIQKKLGYIKNLGCNAIYLTPVFQSDSNHKYDIADYYQVDPHFGTNEDLKELIVKAHDRGIKIVLDAVFNHCSENLMQFQDVVKKGRASEYYDWFIVHGDVINREKCNYETFASCAYMPKFNTSNPEVQRFLLDVATYYIREYDIDGWRLDVSDEISHDFWRAFRKEVKSSKKDAVIIGENWHDASNYLRGDQYDSIMNYAFTKASLDYLAWGKFDATQVAHKLNAILMRNTDTVNRMMLNLLDSHDTHRIYKELNSNRFMTKAALCLLYFFPGVPCIFYGTEILIFGGYDPDCRRCMDWSKTGEKGPYSDIHHLLKMLATIRNRAGFTDSQVSIYSKGDVLYVKRINRRNTWTLSIDAIRHRLHIETNGGVTIYEENE